MPERPKQELLTILACPRCKRGIKYDSKKNAVLCPHCKLKYKIMESGIPDMLTEDAEKY